MGMATLLPTSILEYITIPKYIYIDIYIYIYIHIVIDICIYGMGTATIGSQDTPSKWHILISCNAEHNKAPTSHMFSTFQDFKKDVPGGGWF